MPLASFSTSFKPSSSNRAQGLISSDNAGGAQASPEDGSAEKSSADSVKKGEKLAQKAGQKVKGGEVEEGKGRSGGVEKERL